jgi:adenylate kinase
MIQKRIAVMVYGQPGSGKGTQADLLADKLSLIHFDTGRFLEMVVHDPARQKEKAIRRERKLFDSGKLQTPSFVFREVKKEAVKIAKAGWGLVFSGSPRTLPEAQKLVPILERLYGRERVLPFVLEVSPAVSIARNSKRLLCSFCRAALLAAYYPSRNPKHCPVCGGALYRRIVDNPKTIKVRLEEYRVKTLPIFLWLKERGYSPYRINGLPHPYRVFQNIYRVIDRKIKLHKI